MWGVSLRKFHKQTQKNPRNYYGESNAIFTENGAVGPTGSPNRGRTSKPAEK